jgi:hypothetical protein
MNILHADAILGGSKQKREEMVMPVIASLLIFSYVGTQIVVYACSYISVLCFYRASSLKNVA